ncbi:MAG: glycerate kinase [Actinobacteria bacterium]|uniref:Unannotated protein n=1 Tax=freshwater metagenome TaxID=449393 RepID=A0A6J6MH97_9ZZZZ|nr:glycerate kinase [Actinomycetota bacterium]
MKKYNPDKPLRVLVLPEKFKGSLSAIEAGRIIAETISATTDKWIVEVQPVADGGDGSLAILLEDNFDEIPLTCQGALGDVDLRKFGMQGKHAFIELAEICGIGLLGQNKLEPFRASTFGLGEAFREAINHGADHVTFSLGGSASIDGGFGFLCALGARGFNNDGHEVSPDLDGLRNLTSIDLQGIIEMYKQVKVTALVDVDNPLCGPNGAAYIYGLQKGLQAGELYQVDLALKNWSQLLSSQTDGETLDTKGLGAAGGVPLALVRVFGSPVISGSDWFIEELDIKNKIRHADLVITTEGKFDAQSTMGKITGKIIKESRDSARDCIVIAGVIENIQLLAQQAGFISMSDLAGGVQASLDDPKGWLTKATALLFERI